VTDRRTNGWTDRIVTASTALAMRALRRAVKTKAMISGERQKPMWKAARWPCGVCGKGICSNSIQCTSNVVRSGYTRSVVV